MIPGSVNVKDYTMVVGTAVCCFGCRSTETSSAVECQAEASVLFASGCSTAWPRDLRQMSGQPEGVYEVSWHLRNVDSSGLRVNSFF